MGVLLLLAAQNVFEYDMIWKIIVPIIIIMLGIKLIVKSASPQKKSENVEKGQKECMAAFSSQTFDYADEEKLLLQKSERFLAVQNAILQMQKLQREVILTFSVPLAELTLLFLKM